MALANRSRLRKIKKSLGDIAEQSRAKHTASTATGVVAHEHDQLDYAMRSMQRNKPKQTPITQRGPNERLYHGSLHRLTPRQRLQPSNEHMERAGTAKGNEHLKGVYYASKQGIHYPNQSAEFRRKQAGAKHAYVYTTKLGRMTKHGPGWHTPTDKDPRLAMETHNSQRDPHIEVMTRKRSNPTHVRRIVGRNGSMGPGGYFDHHLETRGRQVPRLGGGTRASRVAQNTLPHHTSMQLQSRVTRHAHPQIHGATTHFAASLEHHHPMGRPHF